jgi:hypothetical protein
MTAAFTDMMNQSATYWAPAANDGFGGVGYAAPVVIACRWQVTSRLIKTAEGQEIMSSATVYLAAPVAEKGYLLLGDVTDEVDSDGFSDPGEYDDAMQIINFYTSPSLDADEELHKAVV